MSLSLLEQLFLGAMWALSSVFYTASDGRAGELVLHSTAMPLNLTMEFGCSMQYTTFDEACSVVADYGASAAL